MSDTATAKTNHLVAASIISLVIVYGVLVSRGFFAEEHAHALDAIDESTTAQVDKQPASGDDENQVDQHEAQSASGNNGDSADHAQHSHPSSDGKNGGEHASDDETSDGHGADEHGHAASVPHRWAVAPFVFLLLAIAVFPLLKKVEHWWESNLHRFYVAAGLALSTLLYYFTFQHGFESVAHVLEHAVLDEYVPFIVLLFSLYTISGGIRIQGDLAARPLTNCAFLAIGGGLASFIGTTGAAMLLIRPLIETNNERKHIQHTVVFFIFVVCNCGGCLLPIGDPPLFLGYLQGVSFLWTMFNLFLPWLFVNVVLILVYFLLDQFVFYPQETLGDIKFDETQTRRIQIHGLMPNALLLVGIILAVAMLDPNKPILGWAPWPYLRESVQLSLVALSLFLGSAQVRESNKFNYHAIVEVAALFIGIFICMQPALSILNVEGPSLGIATPTQFFWYTGGLSSVLDNAPTYVVFFKTAEAASMADQEFVKAVELSELPEQMQLIGISLGAVFLGAMTYIGNGPNFMVRAIAEQMDVRMPTFFGYVIRYSFPILVPVFLLMTFVFF